MKKPIYKEEKTICDNIVCFEFNNPIKDEWNISENFDFINKPFVFTIWVCEIIKTKVYSVNYSSLFFNK